MKFQDIKCFFGYHDITRLDSPPGIMGGLFGPVMCNNCYYSRDGHPQPDWPMPPVKEPLDGYRIRWRDPIQPPVPPPENYRGPDSDRIELLENHVVAILSDMIGFNKRLVSVEGGKKRKSDDLVAWAFHELVGQDVSSEFRYHASGVVRAELMYLWG